MRSVRAISATWGGVATGRSREQQRRQHEREASLKSLKSGEVSAGWHSACTLWHRAPSRRAAAGRRACRRAGVGAPERV